MKEALLYTKAKADSVDCILCNHRCHIKPSALGRCRVRLNQKGKLYAMTYGKPVAINLDPIEKKPLFHFLPGTQSLSIGTVGCNFGCLHCQNWDISQKTWEHGPQKEVSPEQLIMFAKESNAPSISYTYTEPTIFYEYAKETSILAHKNNIKNIFVSNGYMTEEMLNDYKTLDAANIDIKGDEKFYRDICGGIDREKVFQFIKLLKKKNVWVETTNLIIPGYNDDDDSIKQIAQFVKDLDPLMPLHFSAFFPHHKMQDIPPTKRDTLIHARDIAMELGVRYVYCGNTYPGDEFENTYCPNCQTVVIKRHGYSIAENLTTKGKCPDCSTRIAGLDSKE